MWNCKSVSVVPIVLGAYGHLYGAVTKNLMMWLTKIRTPGILNLLQKARLFGTAKILRRILDDTIRDHRYNQWCDMWLNNNNNKIIIIIVIIITIITNRNNRRFNSTNLAKSLSQANIKKWIAFTEIFNILKETTNNDNTSFPWLQFNKQCELMRNLGQLPT